MDIKPVEYFGTDPKTKGVRVSVSPQVSFALPHEHFMYAEFSAGPEEDTVKLYFMSHEVVVKGHSLRRLESAILDRDLAWITAQTDRHRPKAGERGLVTSVTVRLLEEDEKNPAVPKRT